MYFFVNKLVKLTFYCTKKYIYKLHYTNHTKKKKKTPFSEKPTTSTRLTYIHRNAEKKKKCVRSLSYTFHYITSCYYCCFFKKPTLNEMFIITFHIVGYYCCSFMFLLYEPSTKFIFCFKLKLLI